MAEGKGREAEEILSDRERVVKEIVDQRKKDAVAEGDESFPVTDDAGNVVKPGVEPPADPEAEEKEPTLEEAGAQATAAAEAEERADAPPLTEQPPVESPAAAPFDPNAEYEIEVEGQKIKVKGDKILERGRATLQKETAAEYKLQMASELLEEARRRAAALPQGGPAAPAPTPTPPPADVDDARLAHQIQFGTPEQAAEALKTLRSTQKAVSPEQVLGFVSKHIGQMVTSQLEFQKAVEMVKSEYSDLLGNDYLRRLFFVEENRRRAPKAQGGIGDTRPPADLYRSIGDDLRKAFGMKAPAKAPVQTLEEKKVAKANAPVIPSPASARIEAAAPAKPPTHADTINKMRASRHQRPL